MRKGLLTRNWRVLILCMALLVGCTYLLLQRPFSTHADFTTVPNTVFLDTTPATFTITTAGAFGTISYTVVDLSNTTITTGQTMAIGGLVRLALPVEPDGYYTLNVVDHTTQSATTQTIPFAVVSPFVQQADSPFGVGTHFAAEASNTSTITPLIATLGAGNVRNDIAWSTVEQTQGQYTFGTYDPYMQTLQQQNISPFLILDYNNNFYDQGQTPFDAAGFTAFANYAKAVVTHYGPQLKTVEVYNEYNGFFSSGPCARNAACYVQLLRYTYQAIKSVRPDVTVVGGAVFYADFLWFTQVFQDGGLQYMDVISDHPYSALNVLSPEVEGLGSLMTSLENLIKSYNNGIAKPVWISELGWPTSIVRVDERTQADYLVRGAVLSLAAGVQKFFWYDFLNDGTSALNDEHNFGLLHAPDASGLYTPKPSYVAYAVLIRELTNQTFVSSASIGDGLYDMLFTNQIHVLWSTQGNHTITVNTTDPVTVTTMTGKTQTYVPSQGEVTLELSGDPIYLQGGNITTM
ncbi:MAG TPA: hypothetical protein VH593_20990 [Ktedonobacteraceae bacterium]